MRFIPVILALLVSVSLLAADGPIDFPAVENNVSFEQIQALPFRQGDHQLAYGSNPLQFGKLYLPGETTDPLPLVVFIHGGCWLNSFDMSHTYPFLTGLAQAGFAVWSLEYRRTGDTGGGWPGTYSDVKSGIEFVASLASFSIDPNNFILAGHSAGGHLALLAGSETPAAKGVIAIAPITNIISYSQGSNSCQTATSQFMGSAYSQNSLAYRQANPAEKTPHENSTIFHGTLDAIVPIEQSRLTGARTVLENDASHFDWIHPGSRAFKLIVEEIDGMLN